VTPHALREPPAPEMARALAEFESRFVYPLGPGRWFRISHGEDYPRFFRAMGDATCFIAGKNGGVTGALGIAIRPLLIPDGSERSAAYIGDLKVDPGARGTLVLLRLAQAADAWARPQVTVAYGVVMDGTRASPADYSGRAGIQGFLQVGKIFVLRFETTLGSRQNCDGWSATPAQGAAVYRSLSRGRYAGLGGNPAERSETTPLWLLHPAGSACGRLEDTRRAKRLIDNDGNEMLSAHLACFAYRSPQSGAELIQVARAIAASRGFPSLFTAVAEQDLARLEPFLGDTAKVIAPATVYGAGLQAGAVWNINSSEI
jgi:hypothetical protein